MRVYTLFMKMFVCIVSGFLLWSTVGAADFPEKPIQVLVGWPAGSVNDIMDRAVTQPLSRILKQPVIVQNVPGGSGTVVLGRVKTEAPDGYTIFQTGSSQFSQVPVQRAVTYDPWKEFAFLAQHVRFQHYILCRSDSPWKTFEEMIQYVKKNPKRVRYGTSGANSGSSITMRYLTIKEDLQIIHVPFNSETEAHTALLGGHLELSASTVGPEAEYIKTGRLRPLVALNEKRLAFLPDLQTILEKGYEFCNVSSPVWAVPVNTPKNIQKILENALLQAMDDPGAKATFDKLNLPYDPLGSEAVTAMLIKDHERYDAVMKKLGMGIYTK